MLEGKGILKLRERMTGGGSSSVLLVYEHTRTGEAFFVYDPKLRIDQLAQVQEEVAALLRPLPESAEARSAHVPNKHVECVDERRPIWTYQFGPRPPPKQ
jgi:hypothetical protein